MPEVIRADGLSRRRWHESLPPQECRQYQDRTKHFGLKSWTESFLAGLNKHAGFYPASTCRCFTCNCFTWGSAEVVTRLRNEVEVFARILVAQCAGPWQFLRTVQWNATNHKMKQVAGTHLELGFVWACDLLSRSSTHLVHLLVSARHDSIDGGYYMAWQLKRQPDTHWWHIFKIHMKEYDRLQPLRYSYGP